MPRYAFLLSPSFNRVYAKAAPPLALAELDVVREHALGDPDWTAGLTELAGNDYVTFECEPLDDVTIAVLSDLSSVYALFEQCAGGVLRPVQLADSDLFDDDLITIQRYSGKTNEQFTKLMVNVARACCATGAATRLLDPLCGRGTTLNQALMYGIDASGVEVDRRDHDSYATFIRRWLKDKRLKHSAREAPVTHKAGRARRLDVDIGRDKQSYKAGEYIVLTVVNDDTRNAAEHWGGASFDMVVTDLPYGVQHGSHRTGELSRKPLALLEDALPVWSHLMREGASLVLSWNTLVMKRAQCRAALERVGLRVLDSHAFDRFGHRVGQAIERDLIVARKGS